MIYFWAETDCLSIFDMTGYYWPASQALSAGNRQGSYSMKEKEEQSSTINKTSTFMLRVHGDRTGMRLDALKVQHYITTLHHKGGTHTYPLKSSPNWKHCVQEQGAWSVQKVRVWRVLWNNKHASCILHTTLPSCRWVMFPCVGSLLLWLRWDWITRRSADSRSQYSESVKHEWAWGWIQSLLTTWKALQPRAAGDFSHRSRSTLWNTQMTPNAFFCGMNCGSTL